MDTGTLVSKVATIYNSRKDNLRKVERVRGVYEFLKREAIEQMDGGYNDHTDRALKRYICIAEARLNGGNTETYAAYFKKSKYENITPDPDKYKLHAEDIKAVMAQLVEERTKE